MTLRYLRPPGALPVGEFLRRCIQCGQCAQVCPHGSIAMRTGWNPFLSGAPQIIAAQAPCYLCMRCPPVCPSGALAEVPMERAGMGLAHLDKGLCFTYEGTVICRSCYERCPLKAKALILEDALYPVVTDQCVGCGVCEHVCPRKAITTVSAHGLDAWWARLLGGD